MAYIKSYSNYVLKRKHQDINSGTIYERDITTIGGLNQFAKGQVPIYKSGNFIITVNNEIKSDRNFLNNSGWEKNGSEDIWTLSNINESNDVESAEKTLKIVLKQDYYKLKDFAYFGSCSELIRASIIDIVDRFPGELYIPSIPINKNEISGIPVFYTTKEKKDENGKPYKNTDENGYGILRLGGDDWFLVENPHKINIHTSFINEYEVKNPLKYLCLSYKERGLNSMPEVTEYACVTKYKVETKNGNRIRKEFDSKGYSGLTEGIKKDLVQYDISSLGIGSKVAEIEISGITIGAFVGEENEIVYLAKNPSLNTHLITPNENVMNEFYNSLDNFQKILLNRDSNPKYSAVFEVMSENSFGYVTELKTFTFPLTKSEFNLSVNNSAYDFYVKSLQKYAEFYDEIFCDNIWRSMTHESIKNFDWTYTREYGVGEEEEYIFGGTRMQKTLRLIGREFDEIKTYIDALKNYQKVDYGKGNAIPDYFLTDAVNQEGWEVKNIYPYDNNFKQVQKIDSVKIIPYSNIILCDIAKNGYFYKCEGCENNNSNYKPSFIQANGNYANKSEIYDECLGIVRNKVKQYIDEKEYSFVDVNNFFLRMLKLNSKNIFRKKGTIEGIETLLSLFGLKSKRWCDLYNIQLERTNETNEGRCLTSYTPDYEIIEYVSAARGIKDKWNSGKSMNDIDWYNRTKTVAYDTEDYRNGVYNSYQGLPVRAYVGVVWNDEKEKYEFIEEIDKKAKYYNINDLPLDKNGSYKFLYPYFSPNKLIDGNPYYQMYGGWINRKPMIFDANNNVINDYEKDNFTLFNETYRNIRTVNNLKELINLPKTSLKDGDICFVDDLSIEYVLIDGVVYDIKQDNKGRYISTYMINNSAKVGNKIFASELNVTESDGSIRRHVFSEYKENTEIRIYITNNGKIQVYGKYYASNNISFFINGEIQSSYPTATTTDINLVANEKSHCFKLKCVDNKSEFSINGSNGWMQIPKDDAEYKKINAIIDNFKGNNPHTGHLNYDGGKEYISYFETLFKYAIENMQFNERCYESLEYEIENNIKNIGFKELHNEDKPYCYSEYPDSKIHYLGEVYDKNNVYGIINLNEEYNGTITLDDSNISDQIINIKRVDINFFKEKDNYTIKFFDDIIMNYLEQVLPSTIIINVNYAVNEKLTRTTKQYECGETINKGNVEEYFTKESGFDFDDIKVTPNGNNNESDRLVTIIFLKDEEEVYRTFILQKGCKQCNNTPEITYKDYKVTVNSYIVNCDGKPTITVSATKVEKSYNENCEEIIQTTTGVTITPTITYSPNDNNTTNSERIVTCKIEHDGKSISAFTYTQLGGCGGQSVEVIEFRSETIKTINACDTSVSILVEGRVYEEDGYTTNYEPLKKDVDYEISFDNEITENNSNSEVTYKATITGIGKYNGKTSTCSITQKAGPCKEEVEEKFVAKKIIVTAQNINNCATSTTYTVKAEGEQTNKDGNKVTSSITLSNEYYELICEPTISKNNTNEKIVYNVTVKGKPNTPYDLYFAEYGTTTFEQEAGPCDCTCEVKSISVSPTSHTFTSTTDASFSVTIDVKPCSGCTNQFLVYNSSGTYVTSGTSTFSLPNQSDTFTIRANDDTGKTCTLTTTAYVDNSCTCSVTSISVSPTTHTFTSTTNASFSVTIVDNDCTGCTNEFKVYNSSDDYITSGTSTFTLSNQSGTFTIRANDDTGKTCTLTTTAYTLADTYVFSDNTPNTNLSIGYGANGSSMIVTSTKNSNMFSSITVSESCDWVTFGSTFTSGNNYVLPFNLTENTSTTERTCTVTATQGTSNKTLSWTIKQAGKPATCDCSTVSISCNPTNSYTTGNSVSTTVTVTGGTNCVTTWKAYSDSTGELLGSGENGKTLSRTATGSVTFRADACTGKTVTWTISEPECKKPSIRLTGSSDDYSVSSVNETAEWCDGNVSVNISTNCAFIGNNEHDKPVNFNFEMSSAGVQITSISCDKYTFEHGSTGAFGIDFTITPSLDDGIFGGNCNVSGSFTWISAYNETGNTGTFNISIQFNG